MVHSPDSGIRTSIIYIIITTAIYLSSYLYLYKYTLKSVTALAPNTEEKYWRCCWIEVVALTGVLWRVSTTRKGTTRRWELKCCCPNIAIINKNKELGGVTRAGGARLNSGLADDRKNRVFPEKNTGVYAGWLMVKLRPEFGLLRGTLILWALT